MLERIKELDLMLKLDKQVLLKKELEMFDEFDDLNFDFKYYINRDYLTFENNIVFTIFNDEICVLDLEYKTDDDVTINNENLINCKICNFVSLRNKENVAKIVINEPILEKLLYK